MSSYEIHWSFYQSNSISTSKWLIPTASTRMHRATQSSQQVYVCQVSCSQLWLRTMRAPCTQSWPNPSHYYLLWNLQSHSHGVHCPDSELLKGTAIMRRVRIVRNIFQDINQFGRDKLWEFGDKQEHQDSRHIILVARCRLVVMRTVGYWVWMKLFTYFTRSWRGLKNYGVECARNNEQSIYNKYD